MNNHVAKEILKQLGGNRFLMMTGAHSLVASEHQLRFRLPGGGGFCKDGINLVEIDLTPADTYTVTFFRRRGKKLTQVQRVFDVYNDNLQSVFTEHTGLLTSLGRLSHA